MQSEGVGKPLVRGASAVQNAPVLNIVLQDPAAVAGGVSPVEQLGWVDATALGVLATFFVIGLFKGLIWQVSRIAILVVAYVLAGRFGSDLGSWFAQTPAVGGREPVNGIPVETPDTTLYLAYILLFLVVLTALSLLAIVLQKLATKAGLGFFDRLGGGVLGVATGACVVLFGLFVVNMFFRGSQVAAATSDSHALRISRQALDWLGRTVPDDLRGVVELAPLRTPPPGDEVPLAPLGHGGASDRAPGEAAAGTSVRIPPGGAPDRLDGARLGEPLGDGESSPVQSPRK
jgi:uncharacterized membrane protein required for colicin V production